MRGISAEVNKRSRRNNSSFKNKLISVNKTTLKKNFRVNFKTNQEKEECLDHTSEFSKERL